MPLDLAGGEESLKHVVEQAVLLFPGAGVDYLIHNAAYERPVSNSLAKAQATILVVQERVIITIPLFLAEIQGTGCE